MPHVMVLGPVGSAGTSWLKRVVLPVGLAALETCWLYPWSRLLGLWLRPGADAPLLSALAVFGLLLLGRAAARGARRLRWRLGRARVALVALGLLAVGGAALAEYGLAALPEPASFASFPRTLPEVPLPRTTPPIFAAGLGLFLWWRGTIHGRGSVGFDDLEGAFKLGIANLVGFLGIAALTEPTTYRQLQGAVSPYVLGFFFTGLVSLALARLAEVREHGRGRQGRAPAFNRQWLVVLLAVVASVLLLTLGLAQLLTFDLFAALWRPLGAPLGTLAYWLIVAVALPIGLLMEVLIYLIRLLFRPGATSSPPQVLDLSALRRLAERGEPVELAPELALVAKWAAIAVLALVVLAALARAVYWWREGERDDDVEEERDSVWSWSSLGTALRAWLLSLWARLFDQHRAVTSLLLATPATAVPPAPMVATIREIYRQLLGLGAAAGRPRLPDATPYEHLPRLQAVLDPDEDLARITEAYVRARYGSELPPEAEVREVQGRWERVLAWTQRIASANAHTPNRASSKAPAAPRPDDEAG